MEETNLDETISKTKQDSNLEIEKNKKFEDKKDIC